MSTLFRQAALDKISNPEQLDRIIRVVRPVHGLGVVTIVLIVFGGLLWSILSTAPVSVRGQGILLSAEGVSVVSSPSEGHIESILVDRGQSVRAGQTVALLTQPAVRDSIAAKKVELDGARSLLETRRADYDRQKQMQADLLETKRAALAEQIEKLQAQHQILAERRRNLRELLRKGYTTESRLNEAETQLADIDNRIAQTRNERIELLVRQRSEDDRMQREIHEAALRVESLETELQNLEHDYERRRSLISPVDGTVVELNANVGDLVRSGQTILRLLPSRPSEHDELRAIVFVPNNDGKKIKPGMPAHIMPSTTRLQKDGFIQGEVLSVADIPSSREGIMRRLQNAAQVDALLQTGAPFEVEVKLETDPSAPSGYRWSSGIGPDVSIDAGTIASADMIVERRRVISLALPFVDYVFRWLEIR